MVNKRGFTIVELLATLAVAAILVAVAVPSFTAMFAQNRASTLAHTFVTSLNYARSEAIKRGVFVSICNAASSTSCASGTSWSNGWLIFTDTNGSGDGSFGGADILLRVQPAFPAGTTITAPGSRITYQGNGFIRSGTNMGAGTYTLKPTGCKGTTGGREVVISSVGHPRVRMAACP